MENILLLQFPVVQGFKFQFFDDLTINVKHLRQWKNLLTVCREFWSTCTKMADCHDKEVQFVLKRCPSI